MTLYDLFGPLDAALAGVVEFVLLGLVVVNMVARLREHGVHRSQYEDGGPEALGRHPLRVATNVLLVLGSFYYLTLHPHSGMVTAVLVVGLVITDFFEFESRMVEARREMDLDLPMASITASVLVFLYVAYVSLFFLVKGPWEAIV